MVTPLPSNRLSFEDNIATLLEELMLAYKWQRPSLLLAVHKSKFGQDRAEQALEGRLAKLGREVARITVDQDHSDIPHLMEAAPAAGETVFFVSNLDWGGGPDRKDAYRALNIYREIFVDHHLKAVFWLTGNEAATLARFAPDFWAFRHRVIEFTGQRIPRQVELPPGALIWDVQNMVDPYDTLDARIAVREELLAKLPNNHEARSAKIDLLGNLGHLYWSDGRLEQASRHLEAGLELASGQPGGVGKAPLLNGLAILAYESNSFERAVELLKSALNERPDDASLLMNLSVALHALGRNQEALTVGRKALKAAPRDPKISESFGFLCVATGKFDDAIRSFSQCVELAPRSYSYHLALAICYSLVERQDESSRELDLARKLADATYQHYVDLLEAACLGDLPGAVELARLAIRSGQRSPVELRRDPYLSLLLPSQQMEEILSSS